MNPRSPRRKLYDARPDSASTGRLNVFHCGTARPMLITVASGMWHGAQNVSAAAALRLNLPDRAYTYKAPDHWRLPHDTERIPYSFEQGAGPQRGDPGRF
jgi:dTDP-4-dehydrorhamnose 3,5-epimerase